MSNRLKKEKQIAKFEYVASELWNYFSAIQKIKEELIKIVIECIIQAYRRHIM